MGMTFGELLNRYKARQEERESQRQGRDIELTWDSISQMLEIAPQILSAWQTDSAKPESRNRDGMKNASDEVQRLVQFFELTKEETVEFCNAAGFDSFNELLYLYKTRQEERESQRQGRDIQLTWGGIGGTLNIERRKLDAWQRGLYKPESRKKDGKKKAFDEVQRLAQFFELTEEETLKFVKAAGFESDDLDNGDFTTEEPKRLYYFGIKALLTKKQKKKLGKLIKQIYEIFPESSRTLKVEIDGRITDEQLRKLIEDIRDISDDPEITLSMKEEE
jgi:predicted HicB family RNase H-like nuclease